LELAFSTQALRTLCETEAAAERQFGAECAAVLRRRLADLRAAPGVADLVAGRVRPGPAKDQLVIDLTDDIVIVFCANHSKTPRATSHEVDWAKVTRVKILRIGRHDA
jgi:toxin HigB-1